MINLYVCNGEIFVYNFEDWSVLRKSHRIVGELVGNSLQIPSFPLKILPEEACLLASKNVVTLLESPKEITKSEKDNYNVEQFKNELLKEQIVAYKEARRAKIETVADQMMSKEDETRTKEEIVNDLLAKSSSVSESNMIWPIQLSASSDTYQNLKTLNLDDILTLTTPLKYAVYSDLWEKGYFISQGHKFGGDFLVYLGEPVSYHAIFMVKCVENQANIAPLDIIAFGRLGTSVKKRAVLASLVDNNVSYITINWIDS